MGHTTPRIETIAEILKRHPNAQILFLIYYPSRKLQHLVVSELKPFELNMRAYIYRAAWPQ